MHVDESLSVPIALGTTPFDFLHEGGGPLIFMLSPAKESAVKDAGNVDREELMFNRNPPEVHCLKCGPEAQLRSESWPKILLELLRSSLKPMAFDNLHVSEEKRDMQRSIY
mmetsp:Transcript_3950/g.9884  ORF Transcript_3950/g.9884 Transcript_3950/m.9884 type:complete len:111 (+) Transcript_3950:113-445(+)